MVADLTIGKITALAAADAVNPCALAVLALVLIAILTADPKNRRKVLLGGLSFTLAVYLLYIMYGFLFIQAFKTFIHNAASIRIYLYKGLAVMAILLGMLNLRDFINYRPGHLATEMPLFLRPKVKKLISKVTSPGGAFIVGIFVTLFLLPCTIGPYIIAAGILSYLDFFKTIPWILYYNLIFVMPMIAITIIVYIGYSTVDRVTGWKDKHIRGLHMIAAALLIILGAAMLFGWV